MTEKIRKSRISALISNEVFNEFDRITPYGKNSAIVNELIQEYLEAGDYSKVEPVPRKNLIQVSLTIDNDLMMKFRKYYPVCKWNRRTYLDRPEISLSIEYLIKKYLGSHRVGT